MSKIKDKYVWLVFAIIIVAIYLFALNVPLLGPDEPRYSQVAREMFDRSDWITTTLGGHNWFEKPALLYWIQISFYNIFGVNEFAARLGSALFGLGTILSLWLLGKNVRISDSSTKTPDINFANWLMLIAGSSLGLIVFARGASFDIMITFPVTASLVSFFIWESKSENNSGNNYLPLALFYFFIGVALIAKGLIGIVFPFAIVAFYYLLCLKIPAKTFLISLVWGTVLSILVASSWYLPVYLVNGWEFVDEFFIQHHFQRFTSNKFKHPQPFWFFWLILPAMTIPWIPFFLASVWEFAKKNYQYISTKEPQNKAHLHIPNSKLRLFAVCWMLVPLVFFSLSGSKLPGYILPALPAACILTAEFVVRFIENDLRRKYFLQGLGLLTFVVVAILLQFAVPRYAELDSTRHMVEIANEKGYKNEKIINMHTISHNIEFYGNGRLMRSADGRQRRFDGVSEVVNYLEKENQDSVLVLIPHQFIGQLTKSDLITTEILDRNYELEMVAVKLKKEKNEN